MACYFQANHDAAFGMATTTVGAGAPAAKGGAYGSESDGTHSSGEVNGSLSMAAIPYGALDLPDSSPDPLPDWEPVPNPGLSRLKAHWDHLKPGPW